MAKRSKADDCWSFTLRGRCLADEDSSDDDSDEEDAKAPAQTARTSAPSSEDSRLMGELDLASRLDTATYKPNPWSIARANAASRPSPKLAVTAQREPPEIVRPAKKTVLDMLRNPPKETQLSVLKKTSKVSTLPYVSDVSSGCMIVQSGSELCFEDEAHIPSDETLVDISHQPAVLIKEENTCDFVTQPVSAITARRCGFGYPVFDSGTGAENGNSMRKDPTNPETTRQPLKSRDPRRTVTYSSPHNILQLQVTVVPPLFSSEQRPIPDETAPPDRKRKQGSPNLIGGMIPARSRPRPLLAKHEYDSAFPSETAYNDFPGCSALKRSTLTLHEDVQTPRRRLMPEAIPTSPKESLPMLNTFAFRPKLHSGREPSAARELSSHSALIMPSPKKMHVSLSPSAPPPVGKRSPSPSSRHPHPQKAQRSAHVNASPKKRDAYDAFGSPDAAWSTLPSKKRGAADSVKAGRGAASDQKFRVPLRIGAALRGRWTRAGSASGRRTHKREEVDSPTRVVTYLPPPQNDSRSSALEARKSRLARDLGASGDRHRHDGRDADSTASSSSPTFKPMAIRRAALPTMSLSNRKYQTTSDSPPPFEGPAPRNPEVNADGSDTSLVFETSGLADRYQIVRRRVAHRKRQSTQLWDLLGLPSCGVVFSDAWRQKPLGECDSAEAVTSTGKPQHRQEIAIVVWQGLKQDCVQEAPHGPQD
ncbi:hypothetical protein BD414DRAFT_578066 [Trametes punicea]|nr:hypothetical protein BD414DRAFT_578066 [Trametes punicea]